MTTPVDACELVIQRLLTNWTATPLFVEAEDATPPEGIAWTRASIRHVNSEQESLGGVGLRRFVRDARLFIDIFTPANAGARPARLLAQQARTLFEAIALDGTDIRFGSPEIRELGHDGPYYSIQVEAPFKYYERV